MHLRICLAMVFFFCFFVALCATLECRKEQRATIKSCVTWGFNVARTINSVRAAFDDHALSHTQIRHWFRVFQSDNTRSVNDAKRSGQPITQRTAGKVKEIEELVLDECRRTTQQLAREASMSHTTALKVLRKDLKMRKLAAKFVPHRLTNAQRRNREEISRNHLQTIQENPGVLNQIIATDESWFFSYDPRNKTADMQWLTKEEPRPTKYLRLISQKKVMVILFFNSVGIISVDFVEGGTVDSEVYIDSLKRMREAYRCKRPHFWADRQFYLLQDNASPHRSTDTVEYLQSVNQLLWTHPPYSPDLSPCDFWAFPAVKAKIKGHRFQTIEDLETAAKCEFSALPKTDFAWCFNQLAARYQKCVDAGGSYFETRGRRSISREPEN